MEAVEAMGYATEAYAQGLLCKSTVRVHRSANQSIPNASWTIINFNVIDWDVNSEWITNRFYAKEAGYFQVNLAAMGVNLAAGTLFMVGIYKNGVKQAGPRRGVLLTDYQGTTVSEIVHLNGTTDYIEGQVYQNSGAARDIFWDPTATYMSIHQLSKES